MSSTRAKRLSMWIRGIEFHPSQFVTVELDVYVEGTIYRDYENGVFVQEYAELESVDDVHVDAVHFENDGEAPPTYLTDSRLAMGWKMTILSSGDHGKKLRDALIVQIENSSKMEEFTDW